ncbi:hypothetical protein JST56_01985 [Candidatus Dependentiae bacterium]|jgi:hypothetical protein|nr:hypothetical protein [Candidatus Dependentiae bacterium]
MKTFYTLVFSLIAMTASVNPDAESKPDKNFLDQQIALENLIARSKQLNKSDVISTQINVAEHQLQIQALEKLVELSEKLNKGSKKESTRFAFKNLISPSYLLEKMTAGTLHIGGKVYDKSEALIINVITWYILLKLFFPGMLTAASTGFQAAQIIDSGVNYVASTKNPVFIALNAIGHFPQYATDFIPYALEYIHQEMTLLEQACALW